MNARNRELTVEVIDREVEFGISEICRVSGVSREVVVDWVEEGVIEPHGSERWRFSGNQLRRVRTAGRLQRDFGLDAAALPVVLDLLDEIETLRRRVRVLQRLVE